MPRGSVGGGTPSLFELAFHGARDRKLVKYISDRFSEIPLCVAFNGSKHNVSAITGSVVLVVEM